MDACLPYMAAGAAIVGAMWYTQQMPPPHARFSDATACSARRAAVSARTAAASTDAPADAVDSWDSGFQPSGVDDGEAEQQFAGVRPAMNAPPSVVSAGVQTEIRETETPNAGRFTGSTDLMQQMREQGKAATKPSKSLEDVTPFNLPPNL